MTPAASTPHEIGRVALGERVQLFCRLTVDARPDLRRRQLANMDAPMKLFFSDTQLDHQPTQYMVHGKIVDPFENPNRATTLIESLQACGLERAEPGDFGRGPILKVHADHYLAFL